MSQNDPDNSEWEIVDELPSEKRKRQQSARQQKRRAWSPKAIWIGIALGAVCVALVPPLATFVVTTLRRLFMAWWIWVPLLAYWYWRRLKRQAK